MIFVIKEESCKFAGEKVALNRQPTHAHGSAAEKSFDRNLTVLDKDGLKPMGAERPNHDIMPNSLVRKPPLH